jgi:hypothetical protein
VGRILSKQASACAGYQTIEKDLMFVRTRSFIMSGIM